MPHAITDNRRRERRVFEIYEWLHILNDLLIGLQFLIGSFLFLSSATEGAGVWLFISGSGQMIVGPIIRTANKLHVRRIRKAVLHW
jgi:hypothetical protein